PAVSPQPITIARPTVVVCHLVDAWASVGVVWTCRDYPIVAQPNGPDSADRTRHRQQPRSGAEQRLAQVDVLDQVPVPEEAVLYPSVCRGAQAGRPLFVMEEPAHALTEGVAVVRVGQQEAAHTVLDLVLDAADGGRDDRACLPHGFGYGEAEALDQAFLD